MSKYLSVVIPIYNEELRLDRCLDRWTAYLFNYTNYKFEIVCVVNGSTDHSWNICHKWARLWPQMRVINLQDKGKGRAIRAGMLEAEGQYRYMADVDLSTPPDVVPRFLNTVRNSDVVAGVRSMEMPLFRKLSHVGFQVVAGGFTKVTDTQCGFKMFRDKAAEDIFSRLKLTGWAFDVEALWLAEKLQYRVAELVVPWEHCEGSKLTPADPFEMVQAVTSIKKLHPELAA